MEQCPFEVWGATTAEAFECDLTTGHEGQHIFYLDDGESCDRSQPDPDLTTEGLDSDYIVETVRWSVRWPEMPANG